MDLPKQSLNFYMLIPGREVSRHLSFQLEFVTEVQMPFFFFLVFHQVWKNCSLKALWIVPYSWKKLGTVPAWQTFPSSTSCTHGMVRTEVNLQLNLVHLETAFGRAMVGRNTTSFIKHLAWSSHLQTAVSMLYLGEADQTSQLVWY